MEHLTKAQIVLLTLFVSFVASMATGIVVVTLMQQSPEPVTKTINNVIERTIEKITPTFIEKPGKTIVVKDEDLMVAAIARNIKSTVAFRVVGQDGESHTAGVGTIVSADGLIITDKGNFGAGVLTTTVNGVQYALQVLSNESADTLGLGRLTPVSATTTPVFIPVTFGNLDNLKLGQTAIVIGGRDGKTITTGLISNLDTHTVTDKDKKTDSKVLDIISVSTRFSGASNGAPVITLGGEVVGFLSIDENAGSQIGVPASEAQRLIDTAVKVESSKKI
ncbi:MAG: trypsin-like peptidase domain-containing protein [Candidatus Yonathbacteria bacterium]|nr:trypsin-like peptidase domain-containing protein [Candidatus Yonathbacteria bacterium]